MSTLESVLEFHTAVHGAAPMDPAIPESCQLMAIEMATEALREALEVFKHGAERGCAMSLRLALETEELIELADALSEGNLEAALDAQVDRRYIADGTTIALGLHTQAPGFARAGFRWSRFQEAFTRVHAANMAKLGPDGNPIIDATGKVQKPEGWVAADLSDLVRREIRDGKAVQL